MASNIIIIEGIDRVGKTTLANKLTFKLDGFKIFKRPIDSIMPCDQLDCFNEADKMAQLLRMARTFDCNVIFDRFHMTDFVYGIIERRYDPEAASMAFSYVEDQLLMTGEFGHVVQVLLFPTDIDESSKQHGKDLALYNEAFSTLLKHTKLETYVGTYDLIDQIVDEIANVTINWGNHVDTKQHH